MACMRILEDIKVMLGLLAVLGFFIAVCPDALADEVPVAFPHAELIEIYGDGVAGYRDGPLSEARFNRPQGACAYGYFDILVADTYNHCVRLIDMRDRVVTTVLGVCGEEPQADENGITLNYPVDIECHDLNQPCAVLNAGDGSLIEFMNGNELVYRPKHEGRLVAKGALGLGIVRGSYYVCNPYDHSVWKVEGKDSATRVLGTGQPGYDDKIRDGSLSPLYSPTDILYFYQPNATSPFYLVDSGNEMIRYAYKGDEIEWILLPWIGGGPPQYRTLEPEAGQMYDLEKPYRIVAANTDNEHFFVSNPASRKVTHFDYKRQASVFLGEGAYGVGAQELEIPYAMAVVPVQGSNSLEFLVFDSEDRLLEYKIIFKQEENPGK